MKKYRIYFGIDTTYESIDIEAKSEKEAEEIFKGMSADEVLDLSGCVPEFEIEDVEEIAGEPK